ncbi:glutamate-5-semialdehyde dehydrogenase [Terracoccus luteus]|jgi:glutamate-5-semialdehyde dehydrogenase|uniref:Gamma-glutamyl phosphate reductase n=1 Tax=Terracoccus luteus TaxID=53356 RepID=A0A495XSG4_9MICO|nr:glutamate-5-semialdehyde dehydrogenase [Terracoccus luteus]MBB2987027.1 glutamate-5-semialdehyde dehydrogenase [Terracoccus luteus]MCP2172678.1 glutamate-5-semialdehyde dehydrogenase [Terracoccus luteus]RKT77077.1 glutamate-5-semialdehyde dehydrogenase [Terracoccus luteus]
MSAANDRAIDPAVVEHVNDLARRARVASRRLALLTRAQKDAALLRLADAVDAATDAVVEANGVDLGRAREAGVSESLQDRLRLDASRVAAVAQALRDVAGLPDPVGEVVRGSTLANGLQVRQVRVPMGVIGMIYEARPNVTVDAAGLCLKSGNAVLLRGGSAAASSNAALVGALRTSLREQGLPEDAVTLLEQGGRDAARALMTARGLVDLVIPRGGAELIQTVVRESTVPVIETGIGVCHVYVDEAADLEKALAITLNAKTHRPSVCNAAESLLVHRAVASDFLPKALSDLAGAGVRLHVADDVADLAEAAGASFEIASEADFGTEWHGLEMSVAVVDDLDDAIERIDRFGSGHTEAIVTESRTAARRFTAEVDAAAVMVNASTRFTDGGEFGFGAEIGISTQKLHARGPMALPELTTTKWVVEGDGHIR